MIELFSDALASAAHWVGPFVIGSSITAGALALSGRVTHRFDHRTPR